MSLTGPHGQHGGAQELAISNDLGGGTAASPDLTYGTWSITAANTTDLQLEQSVITGALGTVATEGGVGGATALTLAGAGAIALGQATAGDWQLLKSIDASATTGTVIITGASAGPPGVETNAFASPSNPSWLFGSDFGLLDDTGTGGVFDLTSYKLGTGLNILDVSSATAAQVAALTTTPGATVNAGNEIIVSDGAATTGSATTFANIKGFEILGVTGADGTINMANLPVSINEILYETPAASDVTITHQTSPLIVNTEDNGGGFALTSTGSGLADSFTLDLGNALHNVAGFVAGVGAGDVGALTLTADSIVNIDATGQTTTGPAITDTLGFVSLHPAVVGNEVVTISGDTNLTIGGAAGAIADLTTGGTLNLNNMSITDTDTGVVTLDGSTTLAA